LFDLLSESQHSPDEKEELVQSAAQTLRIRKVDLNRDGRPEYIVKIEGEGVDFCGALANCPRWVFRKTQRGFERIAFDEGARELTPQKSSTKGYRDLPALAGSTAIEDAVVIYKYDGRKYWATDCFEREFSGARMKVKRVKCEH
jgi:hypothetical protein